MIRTQVYLPKKMYQDLKQAALASNKPMAMVLRDGLNKVLYETKKKKLDPFKHFIGQAKTSIKTNAVRDIRQYYKNTVIT